MCSFSLSSLYDHDYQFSVATFVMLYSFTAIVLINNTAVINNVFFIYLLIIFRQIYFLSIDNNRTQFVLMPWRDILVMMYWYNDLMIYCSIHQIEYRISNKECWFENLKIWKLFRVLGLGLFHEIEDKIGPFSN